MNTFVLMQWNRSYFFNRECSRSRCSTTALWCSSTWSSPPSSRDWYSAFGVRELQCLAGGWRRGRPARRRRHRTGTAMAPPAICTLKSGLSHISNTFKFTSPVSLSLSFVFVSNLQFPGQWGRRKLQVGDEMKSVPSGVFIFEWAISCAEVRFRG